MLVLLCWEHCLATGTHHPLYRHDIGLQTFQCVWMCSTAQLVSITLNSAANEPRFTILKERVNVLGMGPLLALASAGLLSHAASLYDQRSYPHQLQSSRLISSFWPLSFRLKMSISRIYQYVVFRAHCGS